MARARVGVEFTPVDARKVEAALARIQAQAKGVNFGRGAESINKLSRPLGKITGQATEFQKSLEASNARVLAFGASVAVINKLSEAFGALVSNTIKVEATFAKINTILGGTQKQLEQFGDGIFKVAQQTGTSFDQVAEGALELARQGLSVEESLSRVSTALKLVRVSGIDANQAVAGLTAAIKGFEGAGLTVAQIADKLAEVDTKFAVSTEDLINGLERASASARVAGVSFDELLGVVTTVQERTQRGGAVIGNAFKTIFARLGRTDTLVALQDLGISVLDAEDNVRGAIPLFQELAVELNKLGLKSVEAGDVIQKVAGVRQRDILISLVEDLNSGQSQFAKSLQVSAGAAGALDSKNQQLNQTLEALINNLTVGGQKLASVLGDLGFTEAAGDILKALSSVVNGITDVLQGEGVGAKFAQGLVKGIGSVLTGPGLALISAIFIKLFVDLTKFGATSLKQILGINKAAAQQNALQQSVLQTLLQNENIQREILALEGNKVAQEQLLLKIYNQQAAALARVQKAAATVTPGLFGAGMRGGAEGVKPKGRASGGYIAAASDGYIAAEARDVSRGVGGAPSSAKVVSIPNFAFGGGKRGTMVANTSEYYVPNYAGGGDAIFNQDMVKSMGLPAGARKINAAGGFIPNFVLATADEIRAAKEQGTLIKTRGKKEYTIKGTNLSASKAQVERSLLAGKRMKQKDADRGILTAGNFGFIIPDVRYSETKGSHKGTFKKGSKNYKYELRNLNIRGPKIPLGSENKIFDPQDEQIRKNVTSSIIDASYKFANILDPVLGKPTRYEVARSMVKAGGAKGAVHAAVGAAFEAAVSSALKISPAESREGGDFDVKGVSPESLKKIKTLFGFDRGFAAMSMLDFKSSRSKPNIDSFAKKIFNQKGFSGFSAASGYIPNFAGGLEAAIMREQAAGLPLNQIRINQNGKLRNAQNPMGLAVTNTRDEPTGRIPNYSLTVGSTASRIDTQTQISGAALNNFAKELDQTGKKISESSKNLSGGLDNSITKIFALQLATSGLTSAFTEQDSIMGRFGEAASSAINTMLVMSTVGANPLGGFGKGGVLRKGFSAGGFKGMFKAFKGITGILGKLKAVAGPVALGFTAVDVALKAFTGKGVFGTVMSGLESLGLVLSKESKNIQKNLNELAQSISGKGITEKITITQQKAREKVEEEKQKQKVEANAPFLNEEGIAFQRKYRGNRSATQTFKLDKEVVASLNTLYGELPTEEDIIKAFPDIDKTEVSNLFAGFSENFGEIEKDLVKAAQSGNKNKVASQIGELQEYYEKLFIELGKIGNIGDAAAKLVEKGIGEGKIFSQTRAKGQIRGIGLRQSESIRAGLLADTKENRKKLATGGFGTELEKVNAQISIKTRENQAEIDRKRVELNQKIREQLIDQSKISGEISGIKKKDFDNKVANFSIEKLAGRDRKQLLEEAAKLGFKNQGSKEQFVQMVQNGIAELTNRKTQLADELEIEKSIAQTNAERADKEKSINEALEKSLRTMQQQAQLELIRKNAEKERLGLILNDPTAAFSDKYLREIRYNEEIAEIEEARVQSAKKLNDLNIELDALKEKRDIASKEEKAAAQALVDAKQDEVNRAKENNTELEKTLNLREKIAKKIKEGTKLDQANAQRRRDLKNLEEDVPDRLANNLENSIANAMNNLAKGTYDSLGDVFLNIALDFGNALMQEINSAVAKSLVQSFTGSSAGKSIFSGIGSFFGTSFGGGGAPVQKNSGGLITGGSGVRDDVPAVLTGGEYVIKKSAVQKYGLSFMNGLNSGGLRGYQSGGYVQGADNLRKGKFWSNTKGNMVGGALYEERLKKARGMDFFVPGTRGAGSIVGKENLLAFSQQKYTSGATDVISSRAGGASINLEDQSLRLTAFGRRRDSPAKRALKDAQAQAYNLYTQGVAEEKRVVEENKQAKKARSKALKQAVIGAFVNATMAGVSAGLNNVDKGGSFFGAKAVEDLKAPVDMMTESGEFIKRGQSLAGVKGMTEKVKAGTILGRQQYGIGLTKQARRAIDAAKLNESMFQSTVMGFMNGGMFGGNSSGGVLGERSTMNEQAVTSEPQEFMNGGLFGANKPNALLSGGEYVIGKEAASMIGEHTLDSINMGRFANGGSFGSSGGGSGAGSDGGADVGEVNITINVDKDGKASAKAGGSGEEDPTKTKEFAKKIKDVVLNVINEEKRVSGSLFTRNK